MKKQGTRLPDGRRKLPGKRLLAAFVSLCMIVSLLPATALAEEGIQDTVTAGETISRDISAPDSTAADTSGLCEHHIRHDESCGYTEGTAEIPCSHQHTETCGGLTDPAACSHTHDDTCGYVPAAAGTPCTFVCEICQETETDTSDSQVSTITEWNWVDEQKTLAEDGRLYLPSAVTAENLEEIAALLPQYIQAGEEKIALTWTYDEATGIFTAALPENYALAEGAGTLTVETVVMGADTLEEQTVTYIDANGTEQTVSATIITSEGNEPSTSGGWFAVLGNVTINHRVSIQGNVKLILADGCSLIIDRGINVTGNNSLTIYGQSLGTGSLSATAELGSGNAGIGGGNGQNGGSITICGGSITANGSKGIPDPNGGSFPIGGGSAGIGGGINGNSGSITIYGGSVTATGESAGIGNGRGGSDGSISIHGGSITANGSTGIGGGRSDTIITINDGFIIANGSTGAGIGGGDSGDGGDIIIHNGTIQATSNEGAGIGGGMTDMANGGGDGGDIIITGGSVTAISKEGGAGIGGGNGGNGGNITITGGSVTATGSSGGAGIGGGEDGGSGTFSTSDSGKALIYATGGGTGAAFSDQSEKGRWSGIIFENGKGTVYGNQSISSSFHLESSQTLNIPANASLTNNGSLFTIDGQLTNEGTFTNNGPVTVPMEGIFSSTGTLHCNCHSYDNGTCVICGGIAVNAISLNVTELKLNVNSTARLSATVSPADATDKNLYWYSSDATVASVDQNGRVTALKAGTAVITASATDGSGKTAACTVTVSVPVTAVTMSTSSLRIYQGESHSLSATVSPADAADKNLYWYSSDTSVASVDQSGKVTGKKQGTCTIYAKAADGSNVCASCTVQVLIQNPDDTSATGGAPGTSGTPIAGGTPMTGDSSNPGLWIGILAISAAVIGGTVFFLYRKKEKDRK